MTVGSASHSDDEDVTIILPTAVYDAWSDWGTAWKPGYSTECLQSGGKYCILPEMCIWTELIWKSINKLNKYFGVTCVLFTSFFHYVVQKKKKPTNSVANNMHIIKYIQIFSVRAGMILQNNKSRMVHWYSFRIQVLCIIGTSNVYFMLEEPKYHA